MLLALTVISLLKTGLLFTGLHHLFCIMVCDLHENALKVSLLADKAAYGNSGFHERF